MTDSELKELYIQRIDQTGSGCTGDDDDWWRPCIESMRKCIEAPTLDLAVEALRRDGWEKPVECAEILRGPPKTKCQTCGGTGFVG